MEQQQQGSNEMRQTVTQPAPDHYLKSLSNYDEELEHLYHHLLGEVETIVPIYHTDKKTVLNYQKGWVQSENPTMKKNGAHYIIQFLEGCGPNKINTVNFLDEDRLLLLLRAKLLAYRKDMRMQEQCAVPLPPHCKLCGSVLALNATECHKCNIVFAEGENKQYFSKGHPEDCRCFNMDLGKRRSLDEIVDNLVEMSMRASLQGKYLQLIAKTYGTSEVRQSSVAFAPPQKRGLIDSINPFRR